MEHTTPGGYAQIRAPGQCHRASPIEPTLATWFLTPSEDNKGLHLLQPVMLNDLKLPAQHMVRLGGRAWVSFDHGGEPLAAQVYRYSRQLFLARFSPAQ